MSERIYCGWKEMAEALRRPGRRAPSIDTVKRWVSRAVNPLPAYFDAQGWYLRHSEAVVWLNQSTVPGHVQMARLRDRRKDRYQTSAPACSKRSSLGHPSEDRARFRGENGRV